MLTTDGITEMYRVFIAISLPEHVKDEIQRAQAQLRGALPAKCVRWARREQFHLTLKFLGNVDVRRLETLIASIRGACAGFGALRLRAGQIGVFPDARRPRVIWTRVRDGRDRLPALQRAVETAAGEFTSEAPEPAKPPRVISPGRPWLVPNISAARVARLGPLCEIQRVRNSRNEPHSGPPFTGHVTLGRCRMITRAQAETLSAMAKAMEDGVFGEWTADRLEIIRSQLAPGGSRYTTLASLPLALP